MATKKRAASKKKAASRHPTAKRTTARKSASRKRSTRAKAAPAPEIAAANDRLTEVARTIGSTMGGVVAKAKRVLGREPE